MFLEPVFMIPVVMLVLGMVAVVSGNPVMVFFMNPVGVNHDFLDVLVPGDLLVRLLLFYHVAALWFPVGTIAVVAGLVLFFHRVAIKHAGIIASFFLSCFPSTSSDSPWHGSCSSR